MIWYCTLTVIIIYFRYDSVPMAVPSTGREQSVRDRQFLYLSLGSQGQKDLVLLQL